MRRSRLRWSRAALSPNSTKNSGRVVTTPVLTPATLRGSKIARSSARSRGTALSDQQLGRTLPDAPKTEGDFQRIDARSHYVRAAFQHGTNRLTDVAAWRSAHRLSIRGRQHAHHGRIGLPVYAEIDKDYKRVVPCMHSVGAPLDHGQKDVPWPCNKEKYIVHFPETREIWSYVQAMAVTRCWVRNVSPCASLQHRPRRRLDGRAYADRRRRESARREDLRHRRVSSACGKTNFAMLIPPAGFEGWKVWTVGDDIAWIKPDAADVCAPSIRRLDFSEWPQVPRSRRIPTQ